MKSVAEDKALKAGINAERVQRRLADNRAREEMRNAARQALTEEGFTRDRLGKETKDFAQDAIVNYLKTTDMQAMVYSMVRQEVDRQLGKLGLGLETVVREAIKNAAADYAKVKIENVMNITLKEHW